MKSTALTAVILIGVFSILSPAVEAHNFGVHHAGFLEGLGHPFSGVDHWLAMLAVGVWASQLGGRTTLLAPACFMSVMLAAALVGAGGAEMPRYLEPAIATSVLILGLMIAFAVRLSSVAILAIVGVFAVFHGYAHGLELPQAASVALYGTGFMLATGLLHAAGIAIGSAMRYGLMNVCFGGSLVAVAGVLLLAG